jgi:TetR/AcrR family transcriptional regulator
VTEKKITSKAPTGKRIRLRNECHILSAATEVFSRKGYDGTRITDIADTAKLPKGNVYYYFSSKEEIYRRLIAQLLQSWDDALKYIDISLSPEVALTKYIAAKLSYSQKYPAESRLFASEILRGAEFLTIDERQHIRTVSLKSAEVLNTWISDGKISPVDPRHLLIMLWASTQFYADFETVAIDVLDTKKLKADDFQKATMSITEIILRGVLRTNGSES